MVDPTIEPDAAIARVESDQARGRRCRGGGVAIGEPDVDRVRRRRELCTTNSGWNVDVVEDRARWIEDDDGRRSHVEQREHRGTRTQTMVGPFDCHVSHHGPVLRVDEKELVRPSAADPDPVVRRREWVIAVGRVGSGDVDREGALLAGGGVDPHQLVVRDEPKGTAIRRQMDRQRRVDAEFDGRGELARPGIDRHQSLTPGGDETAIIDGDDDLRSERERPHGREDTATALGRRRSPAVDDRRSRPVSGRPRRRLRRLVRAV
jgi:hypothetical protein